MSVKVFILLSFFSFSTTHQDVTKEWKKSEHITFAGSYVEIYTTEAHDQGV